MQQRDRRRSEQNQWRSHRHQEKMLRHMSCKQMMI
jgi:hypothetical protein